MAHWYVFTILYRIIFIACIYVFVEPMGLEEKQGLVLVLFLLLFVIGVPLLLLYSMQSTTDANGLPRASNEVLRGLGEAMDVRGVQELLLEALSVAETSNPGVKDYTEVRKQPLGMENRPFQPRFRLSTASFARKRPEKEADLRLQRAEVVYWCHILRRRELLNEDPEPLLRQCEAGNSCLRLVSCTIYNIYVDEIHIYAHRAHRCAYIE